MYLLIINWYIRVASREAKQIKLWILGNQGISGNCQISIEFLPSAPRHMKTRVSPKCPANDCGRPHTNMDGLRPATASSRQTLAHRGRLRVAMIGLGWLQMLLGGRFWMTTAGFGCWPMALGGFRSLSKICSFSSYGETRCFKFKRSRQLWRVFVVSNNNDAKVLLKQMTKFLGNLKYKVSL